MIAAVTAIFVTCLFGIVFLIIAICIHLKENPIQ